MDRRNRNSQNHKTDKREKNARNAAEHDVMQQKTESHNHMVFDDVDVPQIKEPMPVCSICGENIEFIAQAISEGNGVFSHFDCVLKKLTQENNVQEPDKVSYIGHGTFAVVHPDENGNYSIVSRIQYESSETYDGMKKYMESVRS